MMMFPPVCKKIIRRISQEEVNEKLAGRSDGATLVEVHDPNCVEIVPQCVSSR